ARPEPPRGPGRVMSPDRSPLAAGPLAGGTGRGAETSPRRTPVRTIGWLLIVVSPWLAAASVLPDQNATVRSYLKATFDLTDAEIDRVDHGQAVSRTLTASVPREVGTLGVVRVRIAPEFYVARLADIANFKRDPAVLQIGVFGSPPGIRDVADLTLDD